MKNLILLLTGLFLINQLHSQDILKKAKEELDKQSKKITESTSKPSNEEIISGLREALEIGSKNAVSGASALNGFYKNPSIKIPFPKDCEVIEKKVRKLGLGKQADDFILNINRAAEEASKEAAPIFINAIKGMTLTDGVSILKGKDNAATEYLKSKTSNDLTEKFSPIVKNAIEKVAVTKYWEPIIKKYNKIPGVEKKNPDLDKYILEKTLSGLFFLIEKEEAKIRKDPAARITDLLKKVFG